MKYFSLFSGIGGFEQGILQAHEDVSNSKRIQQGRIPRDSSDDEQKFVGEEQPSCVGYSEINKYAVQIYQSNFPEHKNHGDITAINEKELPDFDLLCGGFPCQPFSIAGKRGGFNDTRGTLFFSICRILAEKRPRLLLLENVKGLLSHDQGRTFATIIATLDELGYDLQWQVLNSKNFGVPQNRERVFIVGHLRGTSRPEVFPFGCDGETSHELPRHFSNTLTARYEGAQAVGTYIGEGELHAQAETRRSSVFKNGNKSDNHNSNGREAHSEHIRRLTPRECERLQGFPDEWTQGVSDSQRYKVLGNAVTVNVIREIVSKMLE